MSERLPVVLVPGLNCSPRLYAAQLPEIWRFGPVTIADHTRDDTMAALAKRILDNAPERFALAGLSMGGYIALEIMRQASSRVAKLALLDTGGRDDPPEAQQRRRTNIAAAETGRFDEIIGVQFPLYVHPARANEAALTRSARRHMCGSRKPSWAARIRACCFRAFVAPRSCWSARRMRRRHRRSPKKWPRQFPARGSLRCRTVGTSPQWNDRRK